LFRRLILVAKALHKRKYKKILVPTFNGDHHANLVQKVVHSLDIGAEIVLWFNSALASKANLSIHLDTNTNLNSIVDENGGEYFLNEFSTVWARRFLKQELPENLHEDDIDFVRRNSYASVYSIMQMLDNGKVCWVNHFNSARIIDDKAKQLNEAVACGFKIPNTLITNCHKKALNFLSTTTNAIIKYYFTNAWETDSNNIIKTYTKAIDYVELSNVAPEVFQYTPVILQEQIDSKAELRVFYIGGVVVTAKIECAKDKQYCDWRLGVNLNKDVAITPFELPLKVQEKLHFFMKRNNLITGSFDFIIDKKGNLIFLEINEMGNFIWLEHYNPEISVLDPFVSYLTQATINKTWKYKPLGIHYNDYV